MSIIKCFINLLEDGVFNFPLAPYIKHPKTTYKKTPKTETIDVLTYAPNNYGWSIQNKHFFIDIFQPTRKLHYFSAIVHSTINLQSNFYCFKLLHTFLNTPNVTWSPHIVIQWNLCWCLIGLIHILNVQVESWNKYCQFSLRCYSISIENFRVSKTHVSYFLYGFQLFTRQLKCKLVWTWMLFMLMTLKQKNW